MFIRLYHVSTTLTITKGRRMLGTTLFHFLSFSPLFIKEYRVIYLDSSNSETFSKKKKVTCVFHIVKTTVFKRRKTEDCRKPEIVHTPGIWGTMGKQIQAPGKSSNLLKKKCNIQCRVFPF